MKRLLLAALVVSAILGGWATTRAAQSPAAYIPFVHSSTQIRFTPTQRPTPTKAPTPTATPTS